ncbi:unnamed protein product, partial [Phaeothamnion confervicola]
MVEIDDIAPLSSEVLWRRHASDLLRFATALVGPTDAQDIVVEAVLRCSEAFTKQAPIDERAYLYRAVTRRALDLRRASERRWVRDLAAVGPISSSVSDPNVDVRQAVCQLSVKQRATIYLIYWEDLTERAAADSLGVSVGSVRRHLTRAQAHLR